MAPERKPKVSIGLPVYNGEKYFRQALGSLISQVYKDFEIVISNNRTVDETQAICRDYALS